MNDLCLKFDSREQFEALLLKIGLYQQFDGALIPSTPIDVIGAITRPIGEPDADGNVQTEALPGWHANVLIAGDVPAALAPHIVTPTQRVRVWA